MDRAVIKDSIERFGALHSWVMKLTGTTVGVALAGGILLNIGIARGTGGDDPQRSEQEVLEIAADWATNYVTETIASGVPADSPAVRFDEMDLVALRYEPSATRVVISISNGYSSGEPRDIWVLAFEQPGVYNVNSGNNDGTAWINLVIDDAEGRVISAGSSVRTPAEQARNQEPLPSYEELWPGSQLPDLSNAVQFSPDGQ